MQTSDNDADVETESATTTTMMDDDDFREEEEDDPGSIIAQTTGRNGFDAKAHQRRAAALKPRTGRVKTREEREEERRTTMFWGVRPRKRTPKSSRGRTPG